MALRPVYMSTHCTFTAVVDTANTARDGSGTLASPTWGGTGGASTPPPTDWVLKRIAMAVTGDLADSILTMFSYDGSNARLLWEYDLGNLSAPSATVTASPGEWPFQDYSFPASWDLRFGITAAPVSGAMVVTGFCERL